MSRRLSRNEARARLCAMLATCAVASGCAATVTVADDDGISTEDAAGVDGNVPPRCAVFGEGDVVAETGWVGRAIAVQPDSKVVVAGPGAWPQLGFRSIVVARYLPEGCPDASFGTSGKVTIGFADAHADARDLALTRDGRIVVVGRRYAYVPGFCDESSDSAPLAVRLDADGELDASFGVGGIVVLPYQAPCPTSGLEVARVAEDGSIFALRTGLIAKLGEDGAELASENSVTPRATEPVADLALQPDGKVIAVRASAIHRLGHDGRPDATFGANGSVAAAGSIEAWGAPVAVDGFGRVLVPFDDRDIDFGSERGVVRLLAAGELDGSFGDEGVAWPSVGGLEHELRQIVPATDGALLLLRTNRDGTVDLRRYLEDGTLDPGFGVGGTVEIPELEGVPYGKASTTADDQELTLEMAVDPASGDIFALRGNRPLYQPVPHAEDERTRIVRLRADGGRGR
jgi:uncharacterized delta-60 repeat protein